MYAFSHSLLSTSASIYFYFLWHHHNNNIPSVTTCFIFSLTFLLHMCVCFIRQYSHINSYCMLILHIHTHTHTLTHLYNIIRKCTLVRDSRHLYDSCDFSARAPVRVFLFSVSLVHLHCVH